MQRKALVLTPQKWSFPPNTLLPRSYRLIQFFFFLVYDSSSSQKKAWSGLVWSGLLPWPTPLSVRFPKRSSSSSITKNGSSLLHHQQPTYRNNGHHSSSSSSFSLLNCPSSSSHARRTHTSEREFPLAPHPPHYSAHSPRPFRCPHPSSFGTFTLHVMCRAGSSTEVHQSDIKEESLQVDNSTAQNGGHLHAPRF